jgi:hypothetical protein
MIKERKYATPRRECGGADIHDPDKVEAVLRYHERTNAAGTASEVGRRPTQPMSGSVPLESLGHTCALMVLCEGAAMEPSIA